MQQKDATYRFSTQFMWWAFQVFHRVLERVEIEDIQRRVEDFEDDFDDIGWWLVDEGSKAGVGFVEDGEWMSIMETNGPKKEIIAGWARAIEALSKRVPLDETARQYCLFYLTCRWLSAILGELDALIQGLEVPDFQSSYSAIQPRCMELRQWLQQQVDAAREQLPDEQLAAVDRQMAVIDGALTTEWRDTIQQYARRYAE